MRQSIIATAAIAVVLTAFGCGPKAETPKPDRSLPAQIEGVERLDGDLMRAKPDFGWMKQKDGTMTLERRVGTGGTGGGVVIRVGCGCDTGSYACEAVMVDDTTIKCQTKGDCLSCKWFKPEVGIN